MSYDCDKCGTCCRIKQCKFLTIDNLCLSHDSLPIDCRVDEMYKLTGHDKLMTIEQHYEVTKAACRLLQIRERIILEGRKT